MIGSYRTMHLSKLIELCTLNKLNFTVLNYPSINITRPKKPDPKPEQIELENNMHFSLSIFRKALWATMKQSDAYIYVVCYR